MKKLILTTFTALALLAGATTVQAQHYDPRWGANHNSRSPYYGAHHYNRWNHSYRHHYNRHHGNKYRTSDLAIAGGLAFILGRMTAHQRRNNEVYVMPNTNHHTQNCFIRETYNTAGVLLRRERVCR